MKSVRLLLFFVLSISLLAHEISLTKEEKQFIKNYPTIKVANEKDWPPFDYLEDNTPKGYSIDHIKLLANKAGLKIEFVNGLGWAELVELFRQKKIDVMPVFYKSKEREHYTLFTTPYTESTLSLYARKNSSKIKTINDLNNNIKLGIQAGDASISYFKKRFPNIQIIEYPGTKETIKALSTNKIDAIIENPYIFHYMVKRYGVFNLELVDFIESDHKQLLASMHIGVRKDLSLLHSILQKSMDAITQKEQKKLNQKWLGSYTYFKTKEDRISLTKKEKEWLTQNPIIDVSNEIDYPPFDYVVGKKPMGYSIDLLNILAQKIGIGINFINGYTWEQLYKKFENKELDLLHTAAKTPQRVKKFLFSQSYYSNRSFVFGLEQNKDITHIEQLNGRTIALGKGWSSEQFVAQHYPKIDLLPVSSLEDMIQAVLDKDAIVGVENIDTLQYYLTTKRIKNIKPLFYFEAFDRQRDNNFHFVAHNDAKPLITMLNKALDSLTPDEINSLEKKWFGNIEKGSKKIQLTNKEFNYLNSKDKITMCIDPSWMPLESFDKDGNHIGMTADYYTLFSDILKTKFEVIPTNSWTHSLDLAQQRKCDILSLAMQTPKRSQYLNFTTPYLSIPLVIVTNMDIPFINNVSELDGLKVGIPKGYAFSEFIKTKYTNIEVVDVENIDEGLEKVYNGELQAYIGTLTSVGYKIQNEYLGELKITGKVDENWELGIGVRNDDLLLLNILQKAVDFITQEQHNSILTKWVSVKYDQGVDYTLVYQVIAFFIILLLIGIWRYNNICKLNKVIEKQNDDLKVAKETFEQLVYGASDPILLIQDGKFISCNDAILDVLQYKTKEEILSLHPSQLSPKYQPDGSLSSTKANDMMQICLKEGKNRFQWIHLRSNGEEFWSEITLTKIVVDHKVLIHVIWRDISVEKKLQEKLEKVAVTDQLTNLYNRRKLDEELKNQKNLVDRYDTPYSVILLDIDHFKNINDTYGHDVGDQALIEVSNLLKQHTRTTDIVGRWGGEEFLIICPQTNLKNCINLAQKIRLDIAQHNFDTIKNLTCSFGISDYKSNDQKEDIVKRADNALYKAKENGRNQVAY